MPRALTIPAESGASCRCPVWLVAVAGALALGLAAAFAFFIVFSRSMSPDEGYLMITIQSFIGGNALYDSVFTQYGPLYYFYEWILRVPLAVPLTHDATRILCVMHWLAASAVLGCAARAMTRSTVTGLFVFMQAAAHLTALASEPGHPQEIVAVLLALGMLAATRESRRFAGFGELAIITAALAFTKINVGVFFGIAVVLTMRCQSDGRFSSRAWAWLLALICGTMPFLLTRRHLAAEWCRNYTIIVACAVVAAFLVAQKFSARRPFDIFAHLRIAACLIAPSAMILGLVMLTGTSLAGLVDGLFLTPLKMPGVALLPLPLSDGLLVNAAASLALAIVVRWKAGEAPTRGAVAVLKAVFGIVGTLVLVGNAKTQFAFLLPWVWLVVVPVEVEGAGNPVSRFPRILLGLAAAWQSLQAYPIAGTQVTTATLLLVLACAICLHDAFGFGFVRRPMSIVREHLALLAPRRLQLMQVLALVALLGVFTGVWCKLGDARHDYTSQPALDLPGSRLVHMDAEVTAMYRELAAYLEKECDTFVTYPGINSLYFWAGKRPPTHLNSTGWGQLSHAQQEQILGGLRSSRRPLLVVVAAAAQSWSQGAPPPILPLVRCVSEDCREVKRIGRFIVFVPKRTGETARRE